MFLTFSGRRQIKIFILPIILFDHIDLMYFFICNCLHFVRFLTQVYPCQRHQETGTLSWSQAHT